MASSVAANLLLVGLIASACSGQEPSWQPNRIPANSAAQPLNNSSVQQANSKRLAANAAPSPNAAPHQPTQGGGVVLRWKSSSTTPTNAATQSTTASAAFQHQQTESSRPTAQDVFGSTAETNTTANNPLRSDSYNPNTNIRPVVYQQPEARSSESSFGTSSRFVGMQSEGLAPPALPPGSLPNRLPDTPQSSLPTLPPAANNPQLQLPRFDSPQIQPADPLDNPELPPPPTTGDGTQASPSDGRQLPDESEPQSNPFPPRPNLGQDDSEPEPIPRPDTDDEESGGTELKRRDEAANSTSCDDIRAQTRTPLTSITLDVSPAFGAGSRNSRKSGEQQRLDFATSAEVRDWTNYRGELVARGRLINLRDGRVVIDVGGSEQTVPMLDLSDADVTYVGEAWNIPGRCGTGFEPFVGRNHFASTVQWKASNLGHKPLYFEDVQLERYGHETGPVLQPLLSTAHFFGNIAVLPYKMGIHPPNECQYPLGYFRPGNCAPYMLQPIPISLRGAAVQAGVVTGAAALLP